MHRSLTPGRLTRGRLLGSHLGQALTYLNGRRSAQGLVNDAIALRQLHQACQFLGVRIGVEIEAEANRLESDRRGLVDPQRAAEVEIAFGRNDAALEVDA